MRSPKEFYESIHYDHDVVYYVPVFFRNDGDFPYYPGFTHSMEYATTDEQMAWSFEPDYVLELKGRFNAKTPPILDYLTNHGNGD